jgi:hypothetical protein
MISILIRRATRDQAVPDGSAQKIPAGSKYQIRQQNDEKKLEHERSC